ncbi:hypothetical protein GIB67_005512 [Kingdonia uniflora]|uniref:Protein kinase domain-containing protein n=1 Tax=Kingdonia uniflora TaxID=39325 RepID=A0A7J7NI19_9MAGN|nr:hypothetical protein GIB67_005512 [Kingdonia uniflora]
MVFNATRRPFQANLLNLLIYNSGWSSIVQTRNTPMEVYVVFVLFLLVQFTVGQELSSGVERVGLFELRGSLGIRSRDWPRRSDPCLSWVGVECRNDGRVIGVNVSGLRRTRVARLNPQRKFSVDGLFNLTELVSFNASGFRLSGEIPEWFGERLLVIEVLDLRGCSLTGVIPQTFGALTSLLTLDLSRNSFTGSLTSSLVSLTKLSLFDISSNNISGTIPSFLWALPNLQFLNLSDNYFQGKVSNVTNKNMSLSKNCLRDLLNQRTLEECTLFYADSGLSFDNFGTPNTTQPIPAAKGKTRWVYILVGIFGGLGLIVILIVVIVVCLKTYEKDNDERRSTSSGASIDVSSVVVSFTYEQLLKSAGDFSDSNLIKHGHSGDLFRGILDSGVLVVIKRIDIRLIKNVSYMAELDLFSKASHTRLISLMGHCLEHEYEKLLVYKYMLNGDLSSSLYKKTEPEDDNLQSLDWITRMKIAIGAAEGLCYLHHECSPPRIHRDVQASSILLDDKFEVRLGSLSEVCTQEGDFHQNAISRLLRLPKTSEQPPSGSSLPTWASDVFDFGKVLLELVTGKLGISASTDDAINDWLTHTLPYININDKELVTNIVDPSLIVNEDLLEEVWSVAVVAKSCLNPNLSKRPLMRYVLRALENPLKVIRGENFNSKRLRSFSRGSLSGALFGSQRQSSSDILPVSLPTNREGTARVTDDVFPEQAGEEDIEKPNEE